MANTQATKQEAKEYVIDLILNYIVSNATLYDAATSLDVPIDVNDYRRYVDTTTGQITVNENSSVDSNFILYERDYRENFSTDLLDAVDDIVENCITVVSDEYDLTSVSTSAWTYIKGGNSCTDFDQFEFGGISFSGGNGISDYINNCTTPTFVGSMSCNNNKSIKLFLTEDVLDSLSQFISITQQQTNIDETLAEDVLDTNIYELLPSGLTRQEQIDKFFADYANLKGDSPNNSNWPWDENYNPGVDNINDHWSNQTLDDNYTEDHDITFNPLGFIPRLNEDAVGTVNEGQTLQSLRDDLNNFLLDIDTEEEVTDEDQRPEYENQAGGYLKFRGLNQAIIIRNTEGIDIGLDTYTTTGFTITMWVRFLDKVSNGTLFNFGNPLRTENPTGFMLDTIVNTDIDPDNRYLRLVLRDGSSYLRDSHVGKLNFPRLDTTNSLTVDGGLTAYDQDANYLKTYTPIPIDFNEWYFIAASFNRAVNEDLSITDYTQGGDLTPQGTILSESADFWRNNISPGSNTGTCSDSTYDNDQTGCLTAGICTGADATNDGVDDPQPIDEASCLDPAGNGTGTPGVWTPATWTSSDASGTGTYVLSSGYGAMCKVEVISKSDLLRARGFKV